MSYLPLPVLSYNRVKEIGIYLFGIKAEFENVPVSTKLPVIAYTGVGLIDAFITYETRSLASAKVFDGIIEFGQNPRLQVGDSFYVRFSSVVLGICTVHSVIRSGN